MRIDTRLLGTYLLSSGFGEKATRRTVTQLQKGFRGWPDRLIPVREIEFTTYAGDHTNFRFGDHERWVNVTFAESEAWFNYWNYHWGMTDPSNATRLPDDFDFRKIGETIGLMAVNNLIGYKKHLLLTKGYPAW